MRHTDYLADVARGDVAHVLEKERTYRGSWKRRGGVGAFMMLARKWDRLESMLGQKGETLDAIDQYDIFDHIALVPTGEDGTPLAEVRDLRRYLLLVEAEMVSRGVVQQIGGSLISGISVYDADAPVTERKPDQLDKITSLVRVLVEELPDLHLLTSRHERLQIAIRELGDLLGLDLPESDERLVPRRRAEFDALRGTARGGGGGVFLQEHTPGTPEDGGQHGLSVGYDDVPWIVEYPADGVVRKYVTWIRDLMYVERAPTIYVLEAALANADQYKIEQWLSGSEGKSVRETYAEQVRAALACYRPNEAGYYVLDLARCRWEVRCDFYPIMRAEVNAKEREGLFPWQRGMYSWSEAETKFKIKSEWLAWTER